MTREELKKVLVSKPNELAGAAIKAIKAMAPVEILAEIVDSGAADRYISRDPRHPRSRFRSENVLDACYQPLFGVTEESVKKDPSGATISDTTFGHIPASGGRAEHFSYLLDKGFSPGRNDYRGELFSAIMKGCFYRETAERAVSMELAKILVDKGKVDPQRFAENNYEWTGSKEKLEVMFSLGAHPSPGMLDCALRYCVCSQNPGDPPTGRADVIGVLLDVGVSPSKPLGNIGSSREQWAFLESAGLDAKFSRAPSPLPAPSTARACSKTPVQSRGSR